MLNDIKGSIIGYFADNFFVARLIYADADKNSIIRYHLFITSDSTVISCFNRVIALQTQSSHFLI